MNRDTAERVLEVEEGQRQNEVVGKEREKRVKSKQETGGRGKC